MRRNYEINCKNFSDLIFLGDPKDCKSNNWLNVIEINKINLRERDKILNLLNKNNVNCRPVWRLMHKLNMFKNSPKSDLSNALRLERSIICLPSGAEYGKS